MQATVEAVRATVVIMATGSQDKPVFNWNAKAKYIKLKKNAERRYQIFS